MLHRLTNLPREARDTLFLLAVIAWVIAPQTGNLPVWCSAMALTVLAWRATIAVRGQTLPARWWLWAWLIVGTAATFFTYRTLFGRDAGVTYIVVLLSLKTLELRARRDAFVVFFLGFFTLLSNFFFSQSLLTAAAMLVGLLGLLTALVNSHMPVGRPPLRQAAKTALWMALVGSPIMVVLFVLFPRLAPLWGLPADAMAGRSGLSSTMQVGSIAKLALNEAIAMRIRFEGPLPEASDMYFRGPVFSTFNGKDWLPLPTNSASTPADVGLQVQGPALRYQVTLEGNNQPWVLVLDAASAPPALNRYTVTMNGDLQWLAERPIADLVRYTAESHTRFRYGPLQASPALQDYINLPPGYNPRTLQWATELRAKAQAQRASTEQVVEQVMQHLRTGGYSYTLEPGVYGIHTADEFWFDRKEGFCEHIASSFVLLMRAMGVPARIVTGYQGGEANNVDSFWTVRQSDAHAWAEVWISGKGWVRVDPTSAVAPGRTGTFERLQQRGSPIAQALGTISPQFAQNLRALWDAANNRWNQWVLNYTQDKQMDLLRNLGFSSPSWEDLLHMMAAVLVTVSLCAAAWAAWERHRQDPWLRLLRLARGQLLRAGIEVPEQAPPRQLAALLEAHHTSPALSDWLLALEASRYAPQGKGPTLASLQRQFKQLPWPPAAAKKPSQG
jgi:protein-glutamine gamma-glutamyltransferase